jgi:single-stranded DNA-binding protein
MDEITLIGNLTADPVYRVAEKSGARRCPI